MLNSYDSELIENCFREAGLAGKLADSSILKYRDSIKQFFSIVNKRLEELELSDFKDFIAVMKNQGASSSRIANIISAIQRVIKDLQREGTIRNKLDTEKIMKPKIIRKEVNYLTEDEIVIFLDTIQADIDAGSAIRKVRFMALTHILFQTGARIGEVLSINIGDIDRQNKEIPVIGKGGKHRTLFTNDQTLYWIDQYLTLRKDKHHALFVALNGVSRWKQTDVGRSFRRYRVLSGIQKRFTLHTFRHTFATQYLMKGAGINVVQSALGHSDAVTTLKYYAGAVDKFKVKEMINDNHFAFIPQSALGNRFQKVSKQNQEISCAPA